MSDSIEAAHMLRKEILGMILRYGQESDVTVYQALGALEMVKHDLSKMLEKANEQRLSLKTQ